MLFVRFGLRRGWDVPVRVIGVVISRIVSKGRETERHGDLDN